MACLTLILWGLLPALGTAQDLPLSKIQLSGTNRYSAGQLALGLGLRQGDKVNTAELSQACSKLRKLKVFYSFRCSYFRKAGRVVLRILVESDSGLLTVFDNFVWTSRQELSKRLKAEIPLYSDRMPDRNGVIPNIIRVLEKTLIEHGISAKVRYDDSWWIERGKNVFTVEGISTPILSFSFEGPNKPSEKMTTQFVNGIAGQNFSAAFLHWHIRQALKDFYYSRGYLDAQALEPIIEYHGPSQCAHPVRVRIPVDSGEVFRLGTIEIKNLPQATVDELIRDFPLNQGDVYDQTAVDSFVSDFVLKKAPEQGPRGRLAEIHTHVDCQLKTVSLIIRVMRPGDRNSAEEHRWPPCAPTLLYPEWNAP